MRERAVGKGSGRGGRGGFTLVEVLVATVVVGVGLVALAGTGGYLVRALRASGALTAATNSARSAVERARAGPCGSSAAADSGGTGWAQLVSVTVPVVGPGGAAGRTLTLATGFPCPR